MDPNHNSSPTFRLARIQEFLQQHGSVAAEAKQATDANKQALSVPARHFKPVLQSIHRCSLFFSLQPCTFTTETAIAAYTIPYLTKWARWWGVRRLCNPCSRCSLLSSARSLAMAPPILADLEKDVRELSVQVEHLLGALAKAEWDKART